MKKQLFIIPLLLLFIMGFVSAVDCGAYSYASGTDGTDYFGVNTNTTNSTNMGADQVFGAYTFFTPRLNFTKNVSQSFTGGTNQTLHYMQWTSLTPICNDSLLLFNGSALVDRTNFTWIWINQTAGTWAIKDETSLYNGSTLRYICNRTFVKNVDDLIATPSLVYTDANTNAYFLTQNTATTYGSNKTFVLTRTYFQDTLNYTNWAVGWTYTNRTCIAPNIDSATYAGISSTKLLVYAGLGLLAVLLIVMSAFAMIQIFSGSGQVDLISTSVIVIGGGIVIIVGFVIIYLVAKSLGA
jgi:hypothetical protein